MTLKGGLPVNYKEEQIACKTEERAQDTCYAHLMSMVLQEEAEGDHSFAECGSRDPDNLDKCYEWMECTEAVARDNGW